MLDWIAHRRSALRCWMLGVGCSVFILPALTTRLLAETTITSGPEKVSLIELFTSEGCSSCPPADQWMSRLKGENGLWKEFVPVAFHVDYWDRLGWPDPYASEKNTERQRAYARAWESPSVYTPGFVLDGQEWRGWRRYRSVPEKVEKSGELRATLRDSGIIEVKYQAGPDQEGTLYAEVALLAENLNSHVKRGENKGRKLSHDFVALHWNRVVLTKGPGRYIGTVRLPEEVTKEADALAVWVKSEKSHEVLQAAGGWLDD